MSSIDGRDEVIEVVLSARPMMLMMMMMVVASVFLPNKLSINSPHWLRSNDLDLNYHLGRRTTNQRDYIIINIIEKHDKEPDELLGIYSLTCSFPPTILQKKPR